MIRKVFKMKLYPGQEEEYRRRHNPIWPELEAKLKEHGAHNFSIFRHGLDLFAYVEIESEERWNAVATTAINQKWWQYMATIMESNPDNSPVATPLLEVFHLD